MPLQSYEDYKHLRDRGYPDQAALKLVGDRYRLSKTARNCLFRGVMPTALAAERQQKTVTAGAVQGRALGVDWYNVLITVESHLKGAMLFIADDGLLRDAAAVHGSWRSGPATERAREAIIATLATLGTARLDLFLDAPIAHSGEHAAELRLLLASAGFHGAVVELAASADWPLRRYEGIVASSDSAVLDRARAVLDLPLVVLRRGWDFTPRRLADLAAPG